VVSPRCRSLFREPGFFCRRQQPRTTLAPLHRAAALSGLLSGRPWKKWGGLGIEMRRFLRAVRPAVSAVWGGDGALGFMPAPKDGAKPVSAGVATGVAEAVFLGRGERGLRGEWMTIRCHDIRPIFFVVPSRAFSKLQRENKEQPRL